MAIIHKLAHILGRRDELPNKELALEISKRKNEAAVKELIDLLHHKTKGIQHDSIKVLYEIGQLQPELIEGYLPEFLSLLKSTNNRMQWGAMSAIDSITAAVPAKIYGSLSAIIEASDKGSVITRDHTIYILIKLSKVKKYAADVFELLLDQLRNCPVNQLPMYAEKTIPVIDTYNKEIFISTIGSRINDIPTSSKRNRIEKIIAQLKQKPGK